MSANDELVKLFLNKQLNFCEISQLLLKFIDIPEFKKYKKIKPNNIDDIISLSKYVSIKVNTLCV